MLFSISKLYCVQTRMTTRGTRFVQLIGCRRLLLLYGSETGTAQQVAERVAREASRRHFTPIVCEMNSATIQHLTGELCLWGDVQEEKLQNVFVELIEELKCKSKVVHVPNKLDVEMSVNCKVEEVVQDNSLDSRVVSDASVNLLMDHPKIVEKFYSKLSPLAVVIVAATTGQGNDPENMKEFFKNLWCNRKNCKLLTDVRFGVIALGDSSYQKFNYSGKRINNLLNFLGGTPIMKIGLADDQHDLGPDFVVDAWLQQFWEKMEVLHPLPDGVAPVAGNVCPPASYKVTFLDDSDITQKELLKRSKKFIYNEMNAANDQNPCPCSITKFERVTAQDHFQDVRLIEFDVRKIEYKHIPGDVLVVPPQNIDVHIKEFLNVLNLDGNRKFVIEPADKSVIQKTIPTAVLEQPCTIAECASKYFDIMSVPKRYFFELLSFFTSDEDEKEKFLEFASAQGQQELYDYCNRPKRSIVEVLADFPHTNRNIPFEYLFDLIPMMKPRAYSIASSAVMYPDRAQVLMAVVEYKTILKRPRLGVCSSWLTTLKLGNVVKVWIKKGTLTFPLADAVLAVNGSVGSSASSVIPSLPPVIMIAPGTGCAPFRSYIQERIALKLTHSPMLLFFGCRNQTKDHFFREEWSSQSEEGHIELYTAFSRDQEDKVYVQHRMQKCSARLWNLIDVHKAVVFYAGNAKRVPIDIHEALTAVCQAGLGDEQQAAAYVKNCLEKRYQTETWA